MLFIQKDFIQFIYNKKSDYVAKTKLVQEKRNQNFKKFNEIYFGSLVLASYFYYEGNTLNRNFFENTDLKESNNMGF